MANQQSIIKFSNIEVDVIRKDIKNMHLSVYPPTGKVRLAAPISLDNEVLRLFAISKLGWIKKNIKNFEEQPRETAREFINGESHFFRGQRYLLKLEKGTPSRIELSGKKMKMVVSYKSTKTSKERLLRNFYREQLNQVLPELITKWEKVIGVKSASYGIKLMKTKWGACNIEEKKIWLNLELAKKPVICLEYIIVHELVHLLERNHNDRFVHHMNTFMPQWRAHRDDLNNLPVAHDDWGY